MRYSVSELREIIYEEWVMNIARNNVTPAIQVEFEGYTLNGEKIGCITVPRGKDKPYQALDARYLIRVGTTNRTARVLMVKHEAYRNLDFGRLREIMRALILI